MSLSNKILVGLFSGLLVGLFVGDYAAFLSFLGDAFIGLLQMTVLPYIMFSLILNIGNLSAGEGKTIVKKGALWLARLLLLGIVLLLILPLTFPKWDNASFFSTNLIEPKDQVDFISLYIPSNLFTAMANNMIPAVVLFSIFLGIAMTKVKNKTSFMESLQSLTDGLNQVNKLVIKLTPYGVFAITASIAGTMEIHEIEKLQGYLLIYTLTVVILTFWTFPMLVQSLTPFSYRDVFKYTKTELITIFAASKIIVVLPQLIEDIQLMLRDKKLSNEHVNRAPEVILPLAYPFPNIGTLLILVFVPFGAWFMGKTLQPSDYPLFLSAGVFSSFAAPIAFLPFLLDLLEIPKDIFNLFIVSTVYTDRIRVVLAAVFLITLTILTCASVFDFKKVNVPMLFITFLITVLLFVAGIFGINAYLKKSLDNLSTNRDLVETRSNLTNPQAPYIILDKSTYNPKKLRVWQTNLDRILSRKTIRVGFAPDFIPFSYFNRDSVLVGFDVDMAHHLANDLGVGIEFVPVERGKLEKFTRLDYIDIIMSGTPLSGKFHGKITVSEPYLDLNIAMMVKDKNVNRFKVDELEKGDTITLGYVHTKDFVRKFQQISPKVKIKRLNSYEEFYSGDAEVDAIITSFETGSIETILHPEYQLVNPFNTAISVPLVYPIGSADPEVQGFVSDWIKVKKKEGTINDLYNYWLLGKDPVTTKRRWSIIRDELHWVK